MKFVSFKTGASISWGIIDNDQISDLGALPGIKGNTLGQALRKGLVDDAIANLKYATKVAKSDVVLLAPIIDAKKILCIGLNYADHIAEMNRPTPEYPVVFTRYNDSVVGHGTPLVAPRNSTQFDYEGELAVVIGKTARHVSAEAAMDHVFGYSVFNDGSIRDYQRHTHQFTPGKNFPNSGSFGPHIVTADEAGNIPSKKITTKVNDVLVQDSTLDQLVFDVAQLISYCSEWTTLQPGDVIVTGTPGGVGDSRDPKLWLFPGDVVEVEVEGIGRLVNQVTEEI